MPKTYLLFIFFSLTACGAGSERWKEEVKLSDGRVIVIERELVLESGGNEWSANLSGRKPKENRLSFVNPDKLEEIIEWHSMKISSQRWPEVPLILDITNNQISIFASVFARGGCNLYSKYVYKDGVWFEEQLPSEFEQRLSNLYIFQDEDLRYIDLDKKLKNIADIKTQNLAHVGPKNPDCSHA